MVPRLTTRDARISTYTGRGVPSYKDRLRASQRVPGAHSLVPANFSSLLITKLAAAKDHHNVNRSRAPAPRLGQSLVLVPLPRPRYMPDGHLQVRQHTSLFSGLLGCQPNIRRDPLMSDNSVVAHFVDFWGLLRNRQHLSNVHRVQERRLDTGERGRIYVVSPPRHSQAVTPNPD